MIRAAGADHGLSPPFRPPTQSGISSASSPRASCPTPCCGSAETAHSEAQPAICCRPPCRPHPRWSISTRRRSATCSAGAPWPTVCTAGRRASSGAWSKWPAHARVLCSALGEQGRSTRPALAENLQTCSPGQTSCAIGLLRMGRRRGEIRLTPGNTAPRQSAATRPDRTRPRCGSRCGSHQARCHRGRRPGPCRRRRNTRPRGTSRGVVHIYAILRRSTADRRPQAAAAGSLANP
jgi:hypothetical protein